MEKPHIAAAPGLAWRPRKNGWAAVWICRQDIAKKGFKPTTHQIGVFESELTESNLILIRKECARLQEEMYDFVTDQPNVFGGRIRDLINAYQTDPDSTYHALTYKSRKQVESIMRRVLEACGGDLLSEMNARTMKQVYEKLRWPTGKEGKERIATAHAGMTHIRLMLSFGATYEIEKAPRNQQSECARLREIMSGMRFELVKARKQTVTLRQCEQLIAKAHELGLHSIALAQAMQFDLRSRQKDIIGEWVPLSEPGVSSIVRRGRKWLRGIRWEEINSDLILEHVTSKTGKLMKRDLKLYPMTMAELARIPAERRYGPVVVSDGTGRPWKQNNFRLRWREVADAVGIPKEVFNMDTRAGGITETIKATGGNLEAARKEADHSKLEQTAKYSREHDESNRDTAVIVADFRAKNRV
ncbi:hypothetical protein [Tardiphaga sp.]|jgi:hypothetical protein|uniref:hypothetical protein n=1 Tax=Tardiphaga sp. TaxID=1926292 RepID=UPI0037DA04E7